MPDQDELGKDELGQTMPKPSGRPEGSTSASALEALPLEAPGRYGVPAGVTDIELGRGGMGRVVRLEDTHLKRVVAIKELLPKHRSGDPLESADLSAQFVREARVLARLEHPGVVPVYELGKRADGTVYYAMRRIQGRTLDAVLGDSASLEDRLALLPHYLDLVQTVAYAHSRKVIHRDLKPANVMVGRFGETQVLDWGLAIVLSESDPPPVGETAGTPAYMSPEQADGRPVDPRTDVWSLGVMLFELLTGRRPFPGQTASEVIAQVRHGKVPRVLDLEPRAPAALAAIVSQALQRDVDARYPSAEHMADVLLASQRARGARPLGWMAAALLSVAVALGALAWAGASQSRESDAKASAQRSLFEAATERSQALAEQALLALRARDAASAEQLASAALADGRSPLALGVKALAREQGVPKLLWHVGTEAGCASLAAVGDAVACATLNGVELFSAADGAPLGRLSKGPLGWVHAVAALPNGRLAWGGDDRTLHLWDVASRTELSSVGGLESSLVALASDGEELFLGLRDGRVQRLRGAVRETVWTGQGVVQSLAAGRGVLAAAWPGSVKVRRADGAEASLERTAWALAPLPERLLLGVERSVVSVDLSNAATVWSGHRDDVTTLTLAAGRVVSGGKDGVVRWWFDDGSLDGQLDGFAPGVQALVALSGQTPAIAVATSKRRLEAFSLPTAPGPLSPADVPLVHAWTEPDWLLSGLRDGRIRRVDLATREASEVEAKHGGPVRAIAVVPGEEHPEAFRFLSAGDDGKVLGQRWNGLVETLDSGGAARPTALAVSGEQSRAAWAFADGTRVLFGLEKQKTIAREQDALVRVLAFSPNGRALAAGREDKRVSLVDPDSGKELSRLEPFDGAVASMAWTSDGTTLVTGDDSGAITVWSVKDRRQLKRFTPFRERVGALAISDDDETLAAGSDDGTVALFERSTGALKVRLPADLGDVMALRFTPDGALFAIGTDRVPHRWPAKELEP